MRKVLYILGQFDDLDVEWLARAGLKRRLADGTDVVRQGEANDMLYIVLDGHLAVAIEGVGQVALLGPGEMIGEIGFVDSAPPSATVTAVSDAVVLEVLKRDIEEKVAADEGFGFRFYKAIALFLADRLRQAHDLRKRQAGTGLDLASSEVQVDELDDKLLDSLSLAGDRFDRLLRTLAGVA